MRSRHTQTFYFLEDFLRFAPSVVVCAIFLRFFEIQTSPDMLLALPILSHLSTVTKPDTVLIVLMLPVHFFTATPPLMVFIRSTFPLATLSSSFNIGMLIGIRNDVSSLPCLSHATTLKLCTFSMRLFPPINTPLLPITLPLMTFCDPTFIPLLKK